MSLQLTPVDRGSSTWIKVEQHLRDRLEVLQKQLEGEGDLDETNRVRGRLKEIRALMKAGEPPPLIEPELLSRT